MSDPVGGFAWLSQIPQWAQDLVNMYINQSTATGRITIPASYEEPGMAVGDALALILQGHSVNGNPLAAMFEDKNKNQKEKNQVSATQYARNWWEKNPEQWQKYALWQDPVNGKWYKNLRDLNAVEFAVAHGYAPMQRGMNINDFIGVVPDPENPEIYEAATTRGPETTASSSLTGDSPDVIPSNWDLYNAFLTREQAPGYTDEWFNTSIREPNGRGML